MKSLLLHIGLPKTGTSSLQQLFYALPESQVLMTNDKRDLSQLAHRITHGALQGDVLRNVSESEFSEFRSRTGRGHQTIVFSHEGLSGHVNSWSRRKSSVVDGVALLVDALEVRDRTRIVFGIRPQAEWLASLYAGHRGPFAGSFQQFAHDWVEGRILLREDPLDYCDLADSLSRIVGVENVGVLPLHDFGSPRYFETLVRDTSIPSNVIADAFAAGGSRHNVRRLSASGRDSVWRTEVGAGFRLRIAHRYAQDSMAHRIILSRWNLPLRALTPVTRQRSFEFSLTPDVRAQVMPRYRQQNLELAKQWSLDLGNHGYF